MFSKKKNIFQIEIITLFMTSVRSPDSSSSGVGGNGRFGAPPKRKFNLII